LRTNHFDLVEFFFDFVVGASSLFVALFIVCSSRVEALALWHMGFLQERYQGWHTGVVLAS
jgi:hypothetical protein